MKRSQKMLVNTLVLTAASLLMRTIGVSFQVYLTKQIGAAGMGLFQLILTVYALATTLGCAGVRLAATRLVVEENSLRRGGGAAVMRRCLLFGLAAGMLAALALFGGARTVAAYWLMDLRALRPLRILALSLPPVALSAALNGYCTAMGEIPRFSLVNLAEQLVKIAVVVFALRRFPQAGVAQACTIVVSGVTASEFVSCALGLALYRHLSRRGAHEKGASQGILRRLLRIALPDVIGSAARSVLLTIEHLLIPIGFQKSGSTAESSLAVYGTIHGMVLPVLLYPSAILSSLAGLLVPELAQWYAVQNRERIAAITARVLHMTLLFALGTAGILYVFAEPLSVAVYGNHDSTQYLRLLAPLLPVMYLDMTVDGLLKGLDQQLYSMRYNLYDSALCVALVYFLLPRYGVRAYIFILFFSETMNFYLSVSRLIRVSAVRLPLYNGVLKPACCILAAFFLVRSAFSALGGRMGLTAELVFFIAATAMVYFILLRVVGSIRGEDVKWMRGILDAR